MSRPGIDMRAVIREDLHRENGRRHRNVLLFAFALTLALAVAATTTGNLARLWSSDIRTLASSAALYLLLAIAPGSWRSLHRLPWQLGGIACISVPVAAALLLHNETGGGSASVLEATVHCSPVMLAGSLLPLALWALFVLPHATGWLSRSPMYSVAVSGYTGLFSFALIHTVCGTNSTAHTATHLATFAVVLLAVAFVLPRYIMAYWNTPESR